MKKFYVTTLFVLIFMLNSIVVAEESVFEYPCCLLSAYDADNDGWKGIDAEGNWPVTVTPELLLVGPPPSDLSAVTLASGDWVELRFCGEIVDGPGDDIILIEWGTNGEQAYVYLTDGIGHEQLVGTATAATTGGQVPTEIGFDISGNMPFFTPYAIRIIGVDDLGGIPGFDLGSVRARVGPVPEVHMFLKQPLTAKTCWTEIKGGAGNIEQSLFVSDVNEPKSSSPAGDYLGTKTNELSLTAAGVHPEIEGERITGQTSKLGLGQNVEGDLISFIPIASTIADIADHWYEEPIESDKRRRYMASILEGSIHIGGSQQQSVKLAVNLEMKGAASGEASYETQLLKAGVIKSILQLVPTSEVASDIVEKYVLDKIVLDMGLDAAFGLAYDSRFRSFSNICLGLGKGSFYNIDDSPIGWSATSSSDFNLGVIATDKLLPTYWGPTKWLPKSVGTQDRVNSSIIWQTGQSGVYQRTIEVEVGSDIPLTALLQTYAETAGFAAAEARIDEVTITISAVDYPEAPSLVIKSDPEWSFPTFSRVNPYFERSDLLAAASANDLTYGTVSVVDSIAGVNSPDGSALVFVDCNSVSGVVVPVFLPEVPERHIKLKIDVLMSRPLDSSEHAEVEMGLTNQSLHKILWSLDFNDIALTNTPTVENGFTLHTGMIELNLDVGHFENGTAFLTLAGYSEPNDCNMGFVAYMLSIDPKFVVGDFDLDADVDFTDFATFANKWLKADCNEGNSWCQWCDFDESGVTDANDLMVFTNNWLWSRHIPGDLNFSGNVNFVDFGIFAKQWMADCDNPDWCGRCDFDESGKVDVNDLGEFVEYWLLGTNP